ncbi:MAG: MerR family transcriptional regulator [Planctomycetes bacterium]|nr:MerR family transcriptional regulator [Planctomycetota bacterium]
MRMKVGEIAARTGISVRTLHHYDEIGLLSPSHHTGAGHRVYTHDDLSRLQQILSLRQLGMSLDEIAGCLDDGRYSALQLVELHRTRLREQIEELERLEQHLDGLSRRMTVIGRTTGDELLETLKEIQTVQKYYTTEQLEQLAERRRAVGEERIREVEAEWPRLIEEVRTAMERKASPEDEDVQSLVRRWDGLVAEFTGGDAGIARSAGTMLEREPGIASSMGLTAEVFDFVTRARAAGGAGRGSLRRRSDA